MPFAKSWPASFSAASDGPVLALAPMQDVTDLPFWDVLKEYGGPDVYYTEYFRVHATSSLEKPILRSIVENPTGRPVVAQMIGNDIEALVRTARTLQRYPVAAIDLNLGCPAPVVYRKCAGGGLLREPERVDRILQALRDAIGIAFTVKTRVGFDDWNDFDRLLEIFAQRQVDLVTVHGRTVAERYRSDIHYDLIARAVSTLPCPVLANGNVSSAPKAKTVLDSTRAGGLMIGRGAIRNPWIFRQIRDALNGLPARQPAGFEVFEYIQTLYHAVRPPQCTERSQVQKMKKYLNFIALGAEPTGQFLHDIRRAETEREFFAVCRAFLDHRLPMPLEPFPLPLKDSDILSGVHA